MVPSEQIPSRSAVQQRAPCCCSHEMLENDTLVAPFGKEDAAAESQSHAARTQETLVNAVENVEATEIIHAVFCAFDTSQELQRRRNPTRLSDLERSPQARTTRPSDTKPCHTSSRQRLLQARMTKKKGKDARRAGAVNAAQKRHLSHPVFFHTSEHRYRLSLLVSIDSSLSLIVESTVRGVEGVGRPNAGAPVIDG